MKKINCKYFKQGKGKCFFENKCLYRHTLAKGEEFDAGPLLKPGEFTDKSDDDDDFENIWGSWRCRITLLFDLGTFLLVDFDNTDDDSDDDDLLSYLGKKYKN